MLAIKGTYNGKRIQPLPSETLPKVKGETPVVIVFLQSDHGIQPDYQRQAEAAERLLAARDAMPLLEIDIKELIEYGHER